MDDAGLLDLSQQHFGNAPNETWTALNFLWKRLVAMKPPPGLKRGQMKKIEVQKELDWLKRAQTDDCTFDYWSEVYYHNK